MGKEVFILIDYADLGSTNLSFITNCDRLALTPSAMLAFEEKGLSYFTPEDFYNHLRFRDDTVELINETVNLFSALDKKYEAFLEFPRPFTGNIYPFLVFFMDSLYVANICRTINKDYNKVYLTGSLEPQPPFKIDLEFSFSGLVFSKFNNGLYNKIQLLKELLSPECVYIAMPYPRDSGFNFNVYQFSHYLLEKIPGKISRLFEKLQLGFKQKKTIFVVQDEYEVGLLKKRMPNFLFLKPMDKLLGVEKANDINKLNSDRLIKDREIEEFCEKWFPEVKKYILDLFSMYHSKIICRLDSFSKDMRKAFDRDRPTGLFYSMCAIRVYEDICAYIANQMDIPVFYFQHGGTPFLLMDPTEEICLEQNENIKKINIFHSRVEKHFYTKNNSSEDQALGSIKLYNLYKAHRKGKKKILYCTGIFHFPNFKELLFGVPDRENFKLNKEVIETVNKEGLEMDIKIHLVDESFNYIYFKNLLKRQVNKNIRILRKFPVEKIIKNYDLLILDCPGSSLFATSIALDMPILAYLKDESFLRKEVIDDLRKRFYIVKNKQELEKYINLYARGKLESKFSLDIVDKYSFPVNAGNPDIRIADYITKKIESARHATN